MGLGSGAAAVPLAYACSRDVLLQVDYRKVLHASTLGQLEKIFAHVRAMQTAELKDSEVWERPTSSSKLEGVHKDFMIRACQRSPYVRAFLDGQLTMVAPKANEALGAGRSSALDWTVDFRRRILEMEREVRAC